MTKTKEKIRTMYLKADGTVDDSKTTEKNGTVYKKKIGEFAHHASTYLPVARDSSGVAVVQVPHVETPAVTAPVSTAPPVVAAAAAPPIAVEVIAAATITSAVPAGPAAVTA
jgi:hypothetical protein